jgi:hypothetical protein
MITILVPRLTATLVAITATGAFRIRMVGGAPRGAAARVAAPPSPRHRR